MKKILLLLSSLLWISGLWAQTNEKATVTGRITDAADGSPVELAIVYIKNTSKAVESDAKGRYTIEIPAYERIELVFSRIGYQETSTRIPALSTGTRKKINVVLAPQESDVEVIVRESRIEDAGIIREEVTALKL
ncbi:MAG: carboxypeptidase-like regulatory domain-containing protein [Bacteroidota bacterium]